MPPGTSSRPKRARKDTPKIAQHRSEVRTRHQRSENRKRSKAEREDFSLDVEDSVYEEEGSDTESDLPDIAEIGRGLETWRNTVDENTAPCQKRDGQDMEDSEMERIWAGKKRDKPRMFSESSKVKATGPARPAGPPPKSTKPHPSAKRGRSPSPKSDSVKRSRTNQPARARSRDRRAPHDNQNNKRGRDPSTKLSTSRTKKTYTERSSVYAESFRSSRASTTRSTSRASFTDQDDEDPNGDSDEGGFYRERASDGLADLDDASQGDSDEDSDEGEGNQPNKGPKSKVKSSDFKGMEWEILDETVELTQLYLLTRSYSLSPRQLVEVTNDNWLTAVRERGLKTRHFPISDGILTAVRHRIHSFRGRLRDNAVKAGLYTAYGLAGVKQGLPDAIAIVDSLLLHGVHIKPGLAKGYGYFQHEFLACATHQMLFTGRKPPGILYPEEFKEFPLRTLAIICSIIHGVLKAFKQDPKKAPGARGMKKEDQMSQDRLHKYYKIHRKTTYLFEKEQSDRCNFVLHTLYQRCVDQVGTTVKPPKLKAKKEELTSAHFAKDELTYEEMQSLGWSRVDQVDQVEATPSPSEPATELGAPVKQRRPKMKRPEPIPSEGEDPADVEDRPDAPNGPPLDPPTNPPTPSNAPYTPVATLIEEEGGLERQEPEVRVSTDPGRAAPSAQGSSPPSSATPSQI